MTRLGEGVLYELQVAGSKHKYATKNSKHKGKNGKNMKSTLPAADCAARTGRGATSEKNIEILLNYVLEVLGCACSGLVERGMQQ